MKERLHKILANRGIASRRHAEQWIADGRVEVNGQIVREPGTSADPEVDIIRVDGQPLPASRPPRVLMLHKPTGYVCTSQLDREYGRSILELVPADRRYFSIGRLDRDSSGLLLLTDDGDLAHRLSHPRFGTRKTYRVITSEPLTAEQIQRLAQGIELEDGFAQPVRVSRAGHAALRLVMTEGRKREVRRMIDAVGARVVSLRREQIGRLGLGELPPGSWRELSAHEINLLLEDSSSIDPDTTT